MLRGWEIATRACSGPSGQTGGEEETWTFREEGCRAKWVGTEGSSDGASRLAPQRRPVSHGTLNEPRRVSHRTLGSDGPDSNLGLATNGSHLALGTAPGTQQVLSNFQ